MTDLQALRQPPQQPAVTPGFGSLQSFELMQRAAKLLSSSTLVPAAYRAWDDKKGVNKNALANCVVALNMSQRMGADPLMVMQNLYIVEGRPSWSSQWIIAAINGCGRFSPLRFELKDLGEKEVEYSVTEWVNRERQVNKMKATIRNQQCIAWAVENGTAIPQFDLADLKAHGGLYGCCKHYGIPLVESPIVSMEMAVKEGWYGKSGSKWQTMPEVMLRYRTASFFGKLYAPELLMGLQTAEEVHDTIDMVRDEAGTYTMDSRPGPATPESLKSGAISTAKAADAAVSEPAAQQQAEPVQTEQRQPAEQMAGDGDLFASQGQPPADPPAESAEPQRTRQRRQRDIE
ncbi:MAG: hypothetical protein ACRC02_01135 [Vogesella sp.]|uniref:hypothetical protein n=1 Tax=Vogesella sp. TaxID=1904252 RepID=UPI003F2C6AD7